MVNKTWEIDSWYKKRELAILRIIVKVLSKENQNLIKKYSKEHKN